MPPNQEPEASSEERLSLKYFPDNTLYASESTLEDIKATVQREQNKPTSAAPYIVFSDVSPETVEYITDNPEFLGKHARIFFDEKCRKLMIKLIPHAHEVARSLISKEIDIAADRMSIVHGLVPDGSKRVKSCQYTKEPASSWRPATLPPSRDTKWPSLVIECGDLESITRLRIEAEWWLTRSQGDVRVIIVLIIWSSRSGISLEKWVPDPDGNSGSNDSATGKAKCVQRIELQCRARNTASIEVNGGPLRLGFEEVFLRAPSSLRERDIINILSSAQKSCRISSLSNDSEAPDEEHKDLSWTDSEQYARNCKKKRSRIEGCLDLSCALRDPLNIPELRDIFSHPEKLQRPKRERTEPEPAKTAAQEPRSYPSPTSFRLPVEIILVIMDYLHEDNDIYALICLFPVWRSMISQAAWRRKCIKDLLLEEPLPHVDALDWR